MRTFVIAIAGALVAAGAAQADQATPANAQAGVVGFMGAQLGMGLADWKALAYPGRNPAQVQAQCAHEAAIATTPKRGRHAAAPAPAAPTLVCTYTSRLGGVDLLSIPLADNFLVRQPQYDFTGGRLSKIEFRTSIDAFNDLTARFEARYGPASQTLRDDVTLSDGLDLPRVRKIWRLPGGSVEIVDPSARPTQLAVQFTGP
jgi:hypothetical protein